jgi:hypothetical protein
MEIRRDKVCEHDSQFGWGRTAFSRTIVAQTFPVMHPFQKKSVISLTWKNCGAGASGNLLHCNSDEQYIQVAQDRMNCRARKTAITSLRVPQTWEMS